MDVLFEFLVNEELLRQEMKVFDIDKDGLSTKEIVKLANLFTVPYKTMVKRLYETNILSRKELEKFMIITDEQVDMVQSFRTVCSGTER